MQTIQSQHPVRFSIPSWIADVKLPTRSASFLSLIFGATVLFEIFNYSTTEHALGGVMGGLRFLGISWATILALAFCVIDFAGIAKLFSPQDSLTDGRLEGIYLLAAWLLAGAINAATTWWAMTVALLAQPALGNELVSRQDLILYVPILVAGAVWLIRILLIGTLTLSGAKSGTRNEPPHKKPLSIQPAVPASIPVSAFRGHGQSQASGTIRPFTGGRS